jgi:Radical SAM superfamily/Iron-sulfur cluster-binding domain
MPTLEITTSLGCPLACRFCPQDRLVKAYPARDARSLTLENFRTILRKVPRHVRIDFSGMAEPWLNPEATEMVVHAFERRPKVAIYTTLQGMKPDDAAMLIERYGHRIAQEMPWVIHLPDGEGNMTGWRPSEDYFQALGHFIAFRRQHAPPGFSFMTMSRDGMVDNALREMFPGALAPFVGRSRAENLDRVDFAAGQLHAPVWHAEAVLCASTPFYDHNSMLPNGDVVLCAMDYSRRHILGNLLRQDYAELFTGPEMGRVRVRAMGAVGDDDELLCRKCDNAACVTQGSDAHWRLGRVTEWTGS